MLCSSDCRRLCYLLDNSMDRHHQRRDAVRPQLKAERYTDDPLNWDTQARTSKGFMTEVQTHIVAASGEFVGTFFFLYFSFGGSLMAIESRILTASAGWNNDVYVYISLIFGLSLLVNAWIFYRISGGLFNPAVTIGLCVSDQLAWTRAAFLIPTQFVAAIAASALADAMFPGDISNVNTVLTPGVSIAKGLFIEVFMTALLTFTVLMLAAEKHAGTFMAPIGIGLALFVPLLAGTWATGGSLNPARSFGTAVASREFPTYHWLYWLGPCMGAVLAAVYYRIVKYFHYEEVNPGQDASNPPSIHERTDAAV